MAANYAVDHPMHPGHMYGALVENLNWRVWPDENENIGAVDTPNLLGRIIATGLGVTVHIHRQGMNPLPLAPFSGTPSATSTSSRWWARTVR